MNRTLVFISAEITSDNCIGVNTSVGVVRLGGCDGDGGGGGMNLPVAAVGIMAVVLVKIVLVVVAGGGGKKHDGSRWWK